MQRPRKDILVTVALDRSTAALLDLLAETEGQHNRSFVIRQAVQEAGARRGLLPKATHLAPPAEPQA